MLRRRRAVQAMRRISPRAFAQPLAASLDSPHLESASRVPGVDAAQRQYWRAVRAALG
jgi:hypothetical protein